MNVHLILAQAGSTEVTLQPAGAILMVISLLMVCGLAAFCIFHILREKAPSEHHHVPLDIDTHDSET